MQSDDYRRLRREGLEAISKYRANLRESMGCSKFAASLEDSDPQFWEEVRAVWWRALREEQRLLRALRRGGVAAWRVEVCEYWGPVSLFSKKLDTNPKL